VPSGLLSKPSPISKKLWTRNFLFWWQFAQKIIGYPSTDFDRARVWISGSRAPTSWRSFRDRHLLSFKTNSELTKCGVIVKLKKSREPEIKSEPEIKPETEIKFLIEYEEKKRLPYLESNKNLLEEFKKYYENEAVFYSHKDISVFPK